MLNYCPILHFRFKNLPLLSDTLLVSQLAFSTFFDFSASGKFFVLIGLQEKEMCLMIYHKYDMPRITRDTGKLHILELVLNQVLLFRKFKIHIQKKIS